MESNVFGFFYPIEKDLHGFGKLIGSGVKSKFPFLQQTFGTAIGLIRKEFKSKD
jgi:hypothetical protein